MSRDKNKLFFKSKLYEAVELYNRFRKPEAEASILKVDGNRVYVLFKGSFCRTCGIRDWVEDFKYVLEDLGVENELVDYIEPEEDDDTRIGVFEIKGFRIDKEE